MVPSRVWRVCCCLHLYLSKRTITPDFNLDVSRLIPSEPGVVFFFFSYTLSHFCVTLFLLRLAYVIFRETYFRPVVTTLLSILNFQYGGILRTENIQVRNFGRPLV